MRHLHPFERVGPIFDVIARCPVLTLPLNHHLQAPNILFIWFENKGIFAGLTFQTEPGYYQITWYFFMPVAPKNLADFGILLFSLFIKSNDVLASSEPFVH